jgi:hypothetical protein
MKHASFCTAFKTEILVFSKSKEKAIQEKHQKLNFVRHTVSTLPYKNVYKKNLSGTQERVMPLVRTQSAKKNHKMFLNKHVGMLTEFSTGAV